MTNNGWAPSYSEPDRQGLYFRSVIGNYTTALKIFLTARNRLEGKPFKSFRIFRGHDDVLRFDYYGATVARLSPDNVLTLYSYLPASLYKIFPLVYWNHARNRYKIAMLPNNISMPIRPGYGSIHYYHTKYLKETRKEVSEHFDGIKFDMNTSVCLNPMLESDVYDDEKILKSLNKLKNTALKNITSAAVLGAFGEAKTVRWGGASLNTYRFFGTDREMAHTFYKWFAGDDIPPEIIRYVQAKLQHLNKDIELADAIRNMVNGQYRTLRPLLYKLHKAALEQAREE